MYTYQGAGFGQLLRKCVCALDIHFASIHLVSFKHYTFICVGHVMAVPFKCGM